MLPIQWHPDARNDLVEIVGFIAKENPSAARRIYALIDAATASLAKHPYLFRQSERVPGARELVAHPNYVVFYRVHPGNIEILSVVHARQQYPESQSVCAPT